jgi:hypothetical protein
MPPPPIETVVDVAFIEVPVADANVPPVTVIAEYCPA